MSMGMGPGRSFPDFDDYQVKLHFVCPKSDHQSSFFFGTGSRWELSAEKKAVCKIEHKHCQALYVSNSLVEERIRVCISPGIFFSREREIPGFPEKIPGNPGSINFTIQVPRNLLIWQKIDWFRLITSIFNHIMNIFDQKTNYFSKKKNSKNFPHFDHQNSKFFQNTKSHHNLIQIDMGSCNNIRFHDFSKVWP